MKTKIDSLTSTRAFAAIIVFIFHFGRDVMPMKSAIKFFESGNTGVSYFFVLSGFVLYISYIRTSFTYKSFISKRLIRIAPAYLLALGLSVMLYFCFYKMLWSETFLKQFFSCLFFIQTMVPEYALSLNTASWSISVEMVFYALFPLVLYFQKRFNAAFTFITMGIYIATQVCYCLFFKQDFTLTDNFTFYVYHPIMHMSEFFIGMIAGYVFSVKNWKPIKYVPLPFLLLCGLVALIIFRPVANVYFQAGMLGPLFAVMIVAIAVYNPRLLNFKPFIFLGEISYGFYILQFPVRESMLWLNITYLKMSEQSFFYFSIVVLGIVATLSYYLLEIPVRNAYIRRVQKKKALRAT